MLGTSLLPSSASPKPQVKPIITPRATSSGLHPVEPKPFSNTLYQVLRINHNASQVEIKAAYRSLVKQHHPDVSASLDIDGVDFMRIHNAYATLSDPIARAKYDKSVGATSSYSTSIISRYRPTRTWETDQCW